MILLKMSVLKMRFNSLLKIDTFNSRMDRIYTKRERLIHPKKKKQISTPSLEFRIQYTHTTFPNTIFSVFILAPVL